MRRSPAFVRALPLGWALILAPSAAMAQGAATPAVDSAQPDAALEAGVETDAGSLYVFRGLVYSDGPVNQSRAWVEFAGFGLYAWSNVAVEAAAQARRLNEVDLGASYAFGRGELTVTPAVDLYLYRLSGPERAAGGATYTAEVSATITYGWGGTSVFTRHVVDAASNRGAYFGELGATCDRALTPRSELGLSAWVGWASARYNHAYIGPHRAGPAVAGVGISISRRFGRHIYVRPHAELTTVPDAVLRAGLAQPTNGSVGVAFGFAR